jgi:hypothetical protein
MPKDSRDAVVSVRISHEEQARLRAHAEARGMSVSELLRSAALALANPVVADARPPSLGETSTGHGGRPAPHFVVAPRGVSAGGLVGFQWTTAGGHVDGSTLII